MNRIVKEHYPASRLPEDLRAAFGEDARVTVTVEEEAQPRPAAEEKLGWYERHKHIQRNYFATDQEVVDWVRSLRDEWDHRDR